MCKGITSCLFDFLIAQTALSSTKGKIQSTASNISSILVLYMEEKYQNYYTLKHSGNSSPVFVNDIIWHLNTKCDLL